MEVRLCHLCKREVAWVRSTSGASIPIDVEPAPGGDIVVIGGCVQPPLGDLILQIFGPEPRYTQHVKTCPVATKLMKEAVARAQAADVKADLARAVKGPKR